MSNVNGIENVIDSFEERINSYLDNLKKDQWGEKVDGGVLEISKGEILQIENLVINCAKDITGFEPEQGLWELSHSFCS